VKLLLMSQSTSSEPVQGSRVCSTSTHTYARMYRHSSNDTYSGYTTCTGGWGASTGYEDKRRNHVPTRLRFIFRSPFMRSFTSSHIKRLPPTLPLYLYVSTCKTDTEAICRTPQCSDDGIEVDRLLLARRLFWRRQSTETETV
jgi:hypothetical protein